MKLIAGLGNFEEKYGKTRHNIGFRVVDEFSVKNSTSWELDRDLHCNISKTADFVLIKPTTYMNKSGVAVASVSNFYHIDTADILIVHDEIDLDFGKIRLAFNGSSAGNKGVESVIESLSTVDFARLKIGVGHPRRNENEQKAVDAYVLSKFDLEEEKELPSIISKCCDAIYSYLDDGIEATMNRFN